MLGHPSRVTSSILRESQLAIFCTVECRNRYFREEQVNITALNVRDMSRTAASRVVDGIVTNQAAIAQGGKSMRPSVCGLFEDGYLSRSILVRDSDASLVAVAHFFSGCRRGRCAGNALDYCASLRFRAYGCGSPPSKCCHLHWGIMPVTGGQIPYSSSDVQIIGGRGKGLSCSLPSLLQTMAFPLGGERIKRAPIGIEMRQACALHDYCYRHGAATYGYTQADCDFISTGTSLSVVLFYSEFT